LRGGPLRKGKEGERRMEGGKEGKTEGGRSREERRMERQRDGGREGG